MKLRLARRGEKLEKSESAFFAFLFLFCAGERITLLATEVRFSLPIPFSLQNFPRCKKRATSLLQPALRSFVAIQLGALSLASVG